jgi:hypothetical protein
VYGVYTMKRKQIYIAPEQEEALQEIAYKQGVPVSHVIREAVAAYIVDQREVSVERPEDHPLWQLVGLLDDPEVPPDGALNHDHYLYGAPKKRR